MKHLEGINPAILTLFNEDKSVDYEGMKALLDFLMDAKVNGVYVCGTTGEFPLLTLEERKKIAETVVNYVKGKITVYVHIGGITTGDAVELAKHACACGADGIGAVPPYYYSYSEENNPSGPPTSLYKVIRGGGWYSGPMQLRITNRHWFSPDFAEASIGFRCVQ